MKGVLKKFATNQVKEVAQAFEDMSQGAAPVTGLFKAGKAGLFVADVVALTKELDANLAELDAMEKCAKNPTNPLTAQTSKRDPGQQDEVLKAIDATRAELNGNSAVAFLGTLNKEAGGAIKTALWLGYVLGPETAWALSNFRQVAEVRMNELRKRVVSCTLDLRIASGGVTALKCGGPTGGWTVNFEARLAGGTTVGAATATFTLLDGVSGPYVFNGSADTGEGVGSFGKVGTATYTAVADGKSGTLAFSLRGSYPVTVGAYCANGAPPPGSECSDSRPLSGRP